MYKTLNTKKAKIQYMREKLATNPHWATAGVLRIFENQTEDEQQAESTREHNGIGFTGIDGEILSSFAKQMLAGRPLSSKQMAILFKKMPKYAKQLVNAAENK